MYSYFFYFVDPRVSRCSNLIGGDLYDNNGDDAWGRVLFFSFVFFTEVIQKIKIILISICSSFRNA